MPIKWDVIVIGAGPGGALAAKLCAEKGLKTLLLEKEKMPRDKCCSGMVMGKWGQQLLKQEFGDYPDNVMKETTLLDGYALIVRGAPVRNIDIRRKTERHNRGCKEISYETSWHAARCRTPVA